MSRHRWNNVGWMSLGVGLSASVVIITAALRSDARIEPPPPIDDTLVGVMEGNDTYRLQVSVVLEPVSPHMPVVTDLQAVPGRPDELAVLQKGGVALILDVETETWRPWFDLEVNGGGEMGLIGLAFAPDFEESGVFYVHHSPISGDRGVITRFTCDPATLGDVDRGPDILEVQQPFRNHNGGQLVFGPDGYLYAAFGDGGSAFDPKNNGQDGQTLLGSILRLEPLPDGGYAIPDDNPFIDDPEVRDEIFAMGLRNPWRFTFDEQGRLVVGDVGQNTLEEVDLVPPGANLGWSRAEGGACLRPPCPDSFVDPIWEYGRQDGSSVTGGLVASGSGIPQIEGRYVFGDFVSGRIWAITLPDAPGQRAEEPLALGRFPISLSTFGQDAQGRLYVADFEGVIHRLTIGTLTPPR